MDCQAQFFLSDRDPDSWGCLRANLELPLGFGRYDPSSELPSAPSSPAAHTGTMAQGLLHWRSKTGFGRGVGGYGWEAATVAFGKLSTYISYM